MLIGKVKALGFAASLLVTPALALPVASAAPVISHGLRVALPPGSHSADGTTAGTAWSSTNWSGYAEAGTFTGITSTWTVPSVAKTSSATYSSAWIGVDGFTNSNLIQTGTEQDYFNGTTHYDAWWEILPAAETEISPTKYPVSPGDRMSASIYKTSTVTSGHNVWVIKIADTTQGWSFSIRKPYSGKGKSAEWIMEAPEIGANIATLAHYKFSPPAGTGDFDNAGVLKTVVSSGTPTYIPAGLNYAADSGAMIQKSTQVSTPSKPDSAKTAFNMAYGAKTPAPPAG